MRYNKHYSYVLTYICIYIYKERKSQREERDVFLSYLFLIIDIRYIKTYIKCIGILTYLIVFLCSSEGHGGEETRGRETVIKDGT